MVILGTMLWTIACIAALSGIANVTFNNKPVTNPIARFAIMLVMFPVIGLLLKLIGYVIGVLGGVMWSPAARLFGL